jgi:hypothetical protein
MRDVASEKLKVYIGSNATGTDFFGVVSNVVRELDLTPGVVAESADVIVLIVVHSVSYVLAQMLETTYDEAAKRRTPVIIFEGVAGPRTAPTERLLQRFRSEHQVTTFTTQEELRELAREKLSGFSAKVPPPPPAPLTLESAVADIKNEIASLLRGVAAPEVASIWGPPSPVDPRSVFVIMPYSESWSVGLQKILIEVCAKTDMDYTIAKLMNGRFIPQDIWKGITRAAIVIADLSGANPNVTYEIGLADVLGKETILIAQNENVPFDFVGQRLLIYSNTIEGGVRLREELIAHIEAMKKQRGEQE